MKNLGAAFALATLLFTPRLLHADTVRGTLAAQLVVVSRGGGEASVGVGQLASVTLGNFKRFFRGVTLEIKIPAEAQRYRNVVALYIYKNVSPAPATGTASYHAARDGFVVLPALPRAFINIPLAQGSIEPSADTVTLPEPILPDEFPLLITVVPLDKGLPSSVAASLFSITAKPILMDEGLLQVSIQEEGHTPSQPFTLKVDDSPVPYPQPDGYVLSSGLHHLSIQSDYYTEQFQTFGIDQGSLTRIAIGLEHPVSKLTFEAPDGSEILLDGKSVPAGERSGVVVQEGDHTVVIKVGNYSLTKRISVDRGKSYTVSVLLDISVQEN